MDLNYVINNYLEQKNIKILEDLLLKIRLKLKGTEIWEYTPDDIKLKSKSPKAIAYRLSKIYQFMRYLRFLIDDNKCTKCNSTEYLQLHHLHYKTYFKETLQDTITLCKMCHHEGHEVQKEITEQVNKGITMEITKLHNNKKSVEVFVSLVDQLEVGQHFSTEELATQFSVERQKVSIEVGVLRHLNFLTNPKKTKENGYLTFTVKDNFSKLKLLSQEKLIDLRKLFESSRKPWIGYELEFPKLKLTNENELLTKDRIRHPNIQSWLKKHNLLATEVAVKNPSLDGLDVNNIGQFVNDLKLIDQLIDNPKLIDKLIDNPKFSLFIEEKVKKTFNKAFNM